jgi:TRAP-type mannitol/chloroaromatic compound transport system permease small subunit
MEKTASAVRLIALALLVLGALGMLISMFIGVADVVGTKFLDYPVPGTLEFTESTMVLVVFGALAYTQTKRGHIRVEIFYNMGSARTRSLMEVYTQLIGLIFFGLLAWTGWQEALYSWNLGEATMGTIRFPLYPARFMLAFGVSLLVVQLLLDLIADLGRAIRGEAPPSQDIIPEPSSGPQAG